MHPMGYNTNETLIMCGTHATEHYYSTDNKALKKC